MTKTIDDLNLSQWFLERELNFVPNHFVRSNTPLNGEAYTWIIEKLVGRFSLISGGIGGSSFPAFEDPEEAVFYELKFA